MTKAGRAIDPRGRITNEQVTLVALLALGGQFDSIDTEDVAIKADELSPGRFRWRKYKAHIDLGLVRNGLQDARKTGLVDGGALKGWRLTALGFGEAESLTGSLNVAGEQDRLTMEQRMWVTRERARLLREAAFTIAVRDGPDAVSEREIFRFFKIDEYVLGDTRSQRIRRFLLAFQDDQEIGDTVRAFAQRLKQWEVLDLSR